MELEAPDVAGSLIDVVLVKAAMDLRFAPGFAHPRFDKRL